MSDNNSLKAWEAEIRKNALLNMRPREHPYKGPVQVSLRFALLRPKAHYKAGKLRPDAPEAYACVTRGRHDIDKLTRAVLDGLTGTMYEDDSQVTQVTAIKTWSHHRNLDSFVEIAVEKIGR